MSFDPRELTPDGFTFAMSEEFLQAYAAYLKQLRENNPGKTFIVQLSVDLTPAGRTKPPGIAIFEKEEGQ